jgi:hypothetical protein
MWPRVAAAAVLVTGLAGLGAERALARGGPEGALLVIDPTDRESLLVGNYYRQARNIPDRNVIFLDPSSADFASFNQVNVPALTGSLKVLGIDDHIDFVILPPDGTYRLPAGGLVSDECFPVTNFSSSGVYTMSFIADEVLAGVPVTMPNQYHTVSTNALAFDGSATWLNGSPSTAGTARRYLIGASLGYTGLRGNTLQEILDNIDRSVAADGTRPAGTFYYMQTTDQARSGPRHDFYPAAVVSITSLGGAAQHLFDVLPTGQQDCLGIMTGWAAPDIENEDMTILPGAFSDHLTSYAAAFDTANQTKRQYRRGGGAVQLPRQVPHRQHAHLLLPGTDARRGVLPIAGVRAVPEPAVW